MKFKLLIIFLALFLFGCMESKDDQTDGTRVDSTSDASTSYAAKGTITDGLCETGGWVYVSVPDQTNLNPTTNVYPPVNIINEFGDYDLGIEITDQIVRVDVDATCHNEVTGSDMTGRQIYCYNDLSTGNKNVNPLCMITAARTKTLFNTVGPTFQNFGLSEQQANNELYAFFDISEITDRFTSMSLDSTSDANAAYLFMITSILKDRTEVDQMSIITDLWVDLEDNGIINDIDTINSIQVSLSNINYFNIKKNVNDKFMSLGSNKKAPPAYKFGDHDGDGIKNVADQDFAFEYKLLEDKVKITYGLNLDASNAMKSAWSGTPYNRFFAHPFVFDEDMEVDMIAINTNGQYLSVYDNDPSADIWDGAWSEVVKGEAPNEALVTISPIGDVTVLNGITLSDNQDATFDNLPNNFVGKLEFTFLAGVKYWIVLHGPDDYSPMVGNNGTPYNEHGGRQVCCLNGYWEPSTISDDIRLMFTN